MLDAAQKATAFVANRTFQDLENDEILALALVKAIEGRLLRKIYLC
jgi:uncharacterized protein with HEPN domain